MRSESKAYESKAYEYLAKGSGVWLGRDDGNIYPLFITFIQDVGGLDSHLLFWISQNAFTAVLHLCFFEQMFYNSQ